MKTIVFCDVNTQFPYSDKTLFTEALGGIVSSTIRVAEKLGEKYVVYVLQKHRTHISKGRLNTYYVPIDYQIDSHHVVSTAIALRQGETILYLSQRFPLAKKILWCHDHPYYSQHLLISNYHLLQHEKFTLVAVSRFHCQIMERILREYNLNTSNITFDYIYNPIDDDLVPDDTAVDINKLFFCSSPIKGENYLYHLFEYLIDINKNFQLYIANPSYKHKTKMSKYINSIHLLGDIPHSEVIKHMRESLCLFYPNYFYPETFGLVMAEANAVGTPVLTHELGAVREILGDTRQIIDVTQTKEYVRRIMEWRNGKRPSVNGNPLFRLNHVAQEWEKRL